MIKENLLKELGKIAGRKNVLSSKRDILAYSYDATQHQTMPDAIVFPGDAAEIAEIVQAARREKVPVIPRGAGTGISGGTLAHRGGIVVELSRLNKIIAMDTANRRAVAGPGVVNLDLQDALAPLGFIYPPDPASQKSCTLGGNIGENAGGPLCFRYGVTTKYVTGIEAVLPTGEVVNLGGDVEDIPGYDLRGLFIGSEGILGIATKLTLAIVPKAEASQTMLIVFNTLEEAGQAVSDIVAIGIVPGALELMDKTMCWAIEQSVHANYPTDAEGVLLIEVMGLTDSIQRQVKDISEICAKNGAREIRSAKNAAERDALWKGRRGAFGSVARICPSYAVNDGAVPRNKLVPALRRVGEIAAKYNVRIANVAHAGDGNLHPLIVFDPTNKEESANVKKAGAEIMATCIELDGTISGEHGIGVEKISAMPLQFSPADLAVMRRVKRAFDPDDILNPGKLIPAETGTQAETSAPPVITKGELRWKFTEIAGAENVLADDKQTSSYKADGIVPSIVVIPSTNEQVAEIIKAANATRTSVVPFGGGTKQDAGNCLAAADTVLSLKNMNRIIELDRGNSSVRVGAGIVNNDLQKALAEHKLFFPLDPQLAEISTIGGELATGASGPRRFMYGTARDLVLGLTVVTPTGEIVRPGGKTMKNVAGLDLCRMFVNSWGTLGVITEATLRLFPLPEVNKSLSLVFPDFETAFKLVNQLMNSKLTPSAIELIDGVAGRYFEQTFVPSIKAGEVMLLVNIEGSSEVVERQLKEIRDMTLVNRAVLLALEGEQAEGLWQAYGRIQKSFLALNLEGIEGKASVVLSKMGEMCRAVKEVGGKYSAAAGITAHCGNGILYVYAAAKKDDADKLTADLRQASERLGGLFAIEAGPIPLRKSAGAWTRRNDYSLMERLKKELDPNNVLNPGKVVGGGR
jgi:glycolate oxidase subunit GlcD